MTDEMIDPRDYWTAEIDLWTQDLARVQAELDALKAQKPTTRRQRQADALVEQIDYIRFEIANAEHSLIIRETPSFNRAI